MGVWLGPHVTQCGLGRGLPHIPSGVRGILVSRSVQLFGHNIWAKIGRGCCASFLAGERGPHLIQCRLRQDLLRCQVSSSSIQPFGHNTPTSQAGQLQTDRTDRTGQTDRYRQTDRQRSDSTGRTKWSAKNGSPYAIGPLSVLSCLSACLSVTLV